MDDGLVSWNQEALLELQLFNRFALHSKNTMPTVTTLMMSWNILEK